MHRKHHKYADTDNDPHSPLVVKNVFQFNKKTFDEYRDLVREFKNDKVKIENVPRWLLIESLGESMLIRFLFIVLYTLFYVSFSPSAWFFFLFLYIYLWDRYMDLLLIGLDIS